MDASYKIQRDIHVHLIQFFMCPEFWVHIIDTLRFPMPIYPANTSLATLDTVHPALESPVRSNPVRHL